MASNSADETLELDEFAQLASNALSEGDPPPASASLLARLAFEFRDLPTIEGNVLVADEALVGVRGASGADVVQHNDMTLTWTTEEDNVIGIVDPAASAALQLQTQSGLFDVVLEADGSFTHKRKSEPHRFIVRTDSGDWATPWTT